MLFLLVFVTIYVGAARSWDFALSFGNDTIKFYTQVNLTSSLHIPFRNITSLIYDDVYNRILYVDKKTDGDTICGFDLTCIENKCFNLGSGRHIHDLAFNPVTEQVFFTDPKEKSVNWFSLKGGANSNVTRLFRITVGVPSDIVVDSCESYIYWINTNTSKPIYTIERAQLNGTKREIFQNITTSCIYNETLKVESGGLAIDQSRRALYWMECSLPPHLTKRFQFSLYTCDLNKTRQPKTLLSIKYNWNIKLDLANELTVSKKYVARLNRRAYVVTFYNPLKKIYYPFLKATEMPIGITAKYEIKDQINGCEVLRPVKIIRECDGPYCVNGVKDNTTSACECDPGYIGERCEVSVCRDYCLHGACVTDKGRPKCSSCDSGYTGDRCNIGKCDNAFCVHGQCTITKEGHPKCSCNSGYTGDRCNIGKCDNAFCMHGQCNITKEGQPKCSCELGYSGDRCNIYACDRFCIRGKCVVNQKGHPECRCGPGYSGVRCHISKCENFCLNGNCCHNETGAPECSCNAGYSGHRCEVAVCAGFCLNNGNCSLAVDGKPTCQCPYNYFGERCEATNSKFINTTQTR